MVSILISRGADISTRNSEGWTPLMHACLWGRTAVVRLFLEQKGERGLDERNENGCTALRIAIINGHVEISRLLLLAGADHTVADLRNRTPRQLAEIYGQHRCVALMQVSITYYACFV